MRQIFPAEHATPAGTLTTLIVGLEYSQALLQGETEAEQEGEASLTRAVHMVYIRDEAPAQVPF